MATGLSVITNACIEIGAIAPGETVPAANSVFALERLNRIIDLWNTQGLTLWTVNDATYVLTANTQDYEIGPTAAAPGFVATRPTKVLMANLVLTTLTPNVFIPLEIWNAQQWASLAVLSVAASVPKALYYDPRNTNGLLRLWPKPSAANSLELYTPQQLTALAALATTFAFPPGYEDALTLTLAEVLCQPFGRPRTPELMMDARNARAAIKATNNETPLMQTDSGLAPSPDRPYFNYLIGR